MYFSFRFDEISDSISHMAKQKMNGATSAFLRDMAFCTTPTQIWDAAKRVMRQIFPLASPPELDILTAFFINKTFHKAYIKFFDDGRGNLQDKRDSISEMNQTDMLLLQQLMDKKNRVEMVISNVMKKAYENGQAAIRTLKGS